MKKQYRGFGIYIVLVLLVVLAPAVETVAEDVSAEVGAYYEVSDVYMDYSGNRQNLTVILISDDGEYVIKHTIDMRKIRIPTDLFKAYLNVYVKDFVRDIEYWN